ncbi:MAG TPA: amino acid ABC transporter permease [Casimicrobiaceae bacterium]|jgi:polar amino acid transport system permease protein|nr:amino acid ABC transporter permease [Casimicrobiaceae bacterium]
MGNWQRLVWNQRDALMAGIVVTVEVCAIAFAIAVLVGLLLCLVRMYVRPLRPIVIVVIEFFRATPILVQLLWVNYVWPALFGWPDSFFAAAWVALAVQSSGYLAETFRGAIEAIPKGQREAAYSVGMSPVLVFWRIVMPQAALSSAPSIVNQFTVIVKSSTLVSVITVPDLMFQSQKIVNIWYEPIEILTATAALYIVLIFLVSAAGKHISDVLRRRYAIAAT